MSAYTWMPDVREPELDPLPALERPHVLRADMLVERGITAAEWERKVLALLAEIEKRAQERRS